MHKNRFFQFILRVIDWISERRQEIYFILMAIIILSAIGFGIYMYIYYTNNPMFNNPSTIPEHFARPIFIGMLASIIIIIFGTLFAHFITMLPLKRIKFSEMEMEFDSHSIREKEIANQFLYSSTMLHNHTENVRYLLANSFFELKEVLRFLTDSYKANTLEYSNKLALTIDIVEPSELRGREERKLYKSLSQQEVVKSRTAYINRLIKGENILLGIVPVTDTDEAVVVVRREYDQPFDMYDQETFESILGYAMILFDTIIMVQLLNENDILD